MSQLPFEQSEGLRIGTVEFVSPDELKVSLDIDAPESVALNAGTPRLFPRVNGYVLIPVDSELLVGQIEWITIERSSFPKRKGMHDFGLIDLPYPMRRMSVNPLGVLRKIGSKTESYKFQRGTDALPSLGASVLIPTDKQLKSIVESGANRRVSIGTSPLAADACVSIDPDRLFGRHLAVLGNTGSGKSCSVAGLIHWSLEAASINGRPNARFVVLDPNGEYAKAFTSDSKHCQCKVFKVAPDQDKNFEELLRVPLWFWNSAEWCSFTQATAKTQRPTLVQALRTVREGTTKGENDLQDGVRRYLRVMHTCTQIEKTSGRAFRPFPHSKNLHSTLEKALESLKSFSDKGLGDAGGKLDELVEMINNLGQPRRPQYAAMQYSTVEVDNLLLLFKEAMNSYGMSENEVESLSADSPNQFTANELLHSVEATAQLLGVAEHCETLVMRIKGLITDSRMKPLVSDQTDESLDGWLSDYVSNDGSNAVPISIIDLSLVPAEVSHLLIAVVSRVIFEALQRYRKVYHLTLPTVLVMEEAHTFIKRYKENIEDADAAAVCCQVFEKIAREGRKFGLGLVLSSQRPSELSQTVLSQCNTFLLHRISNDRDQEIVHKLVPDNLRGLLRELPSLPPRDAILLGWASELPVLVRMHELPEARRPQSDDPEFWGVWTGEDSDGKPVNRPVGWKKVVVDWTGKKDEKQGIAEEYIE